MGSCGVFLFQAEDGIRDYKVTGVQTCALPIFNPTATPGNADYRNLYIANGDGRAGETPDPAIHPIPQRLDALQGKILRITPRSEERRVGKEWRGRGRAEHCRERGHGRGR